MMKYQDIHTTDSALWKQYQDYMAKGEYDAAKAILAQTQLDNKRIDASLFNAITTELTRLQNQGKDSTWSKNTMAVQANPPANMQAGECYCKLDKRYTPYKVTVSGLQGIPEYYMSDNGYTTKILTFNVSEKNKTNPTTITEDSKDGVYYFYGTIALNIVMFQSYERYGASKTGVTEIYINGEKHSEGTQLSLSDWSLDESANTYRVKLGGKYIITLIYSPFHIPEDIGNGAFTGADWDDKIYFDSNIDIIFTHSINEEEGNMRLRCDINTYK